MATPGPPGSPPALRAAAPSTGPASRALILTDGYRGACRAVPAGRPPPPAAEEIFSKMGRVRSPFLPPSASPPTFLAL